MFPGSSVQEYIKNHPQSKGHIYVSCIFYYEEGSTAPGSPLRDLGQHSIPCFAALTYISDDMDSCQVLGRLK